jgi:hypothetical protein
MNIAATILFLIAVAIKWYSVKNTIRNTNSHYDNIDDFEKMKGE